VTRTTWLWAASLGALTTSFALSPALASHGPIVCPLRLVTGLPCPGCGLVRAFVATAHGDLHDAFALNAFGPIAWAALAIFVAWYGAELVARRSLGFQRSLAKARSGLILLAAAWIGWGVVRLVSALVART